MKIIKQISRACFLILIISFLSTATVAEEPPPLDESLFVVNKKNCGEMTPKKCKRTLKGMRTMMLKMRAKSAKAREESKKARVRARALSEEALQILQDRKNKGEL